MNTDNCKLILNIKNEHSRFFSLGPLPPAHFSTYPYGPAVFLHFALYLNKNLSSSFQRENKFMFYTLPDLFIFFTSSTSSFLKQWEPENSEIGRRLLDFLLKTLTLKGNSEVSFNDTDLKVLTSSLKYSFNMFFKLINQRWI